MDDQNFPAGRSFSAHPDMGGTAGAFSKAIRSPSSVLPLL